MRECRRCRALVRCRSRVVPGAGAIPAAVMFVGIAPGRLGGDRTGIPFSGDRSGILLRAMIGRVGLAASFLTNLVRCNPRDHGGRNRDPSSREIGNCRDFLRAELALVKPRVIVCLGAMVWRELAGAVPFRPRQGAAYRAAPGLLYPLYHPAYVNRGAYGIGQYFGDFVRLARAVAAELGDVSGAPFEPEPGAPAPPNRGG